MQTQEFFANISCLEEFHQGLDNKVLSLSVIDILLGITAIVGNIVILIALHKQTSLNPASKVLLRNLVASDLCVGFVQIADGVRGISILQGQWQICRLLYLVTAIAASISITVSLWTITAISVDRLLALLLRLRYKQVVTIRKVYPVAIASWVNGISNATVWFFRLDAWKVLFGTNIAVCLITCTYSYTRTFYTLRHQHAQVHDSPREPENQTSRVGTACYRKTVFSALWLLLALLFCYSPFLLLAPFALRQIESNPSSAFTVLLSTTTLLMYFNSTLNPILHCWRIKEVRRPVKYTLSCCRE